MELEKQQKNEEHPRGNAGMRSSQIFSAVKGCYSANAELEKQQKHEEHPRENAGMRSSQIFSAIKGCYSGECGTGIGG